MCVYVVSFFDVTKFILNFAFLQKVYPSSSEQRYCATNILCATNIFFCHRMDMKGKRSDAIFPDLIFTIDNFEEVRTTETKFIFNTTN